MKKMLLLSLFFTLSLVAQEKGYIDMHGGKTDSLGASTGGFNSQMNLMDNPFAKQKDDQHIAIEKIEAITNEKETEKGNNE